MDLSKSIKKLDRIFNLTDKLETEEFRIKKEILDWIYSERVEVVEYHRNRAYSRPEYFTGKHPHIRLAVAAVGPSFVAIVAEETYSEGDSFELEIPTDHLLHPEKVSALIAAEIAKERAAAQAAAEKFAAEKEQAERKLLAELKAKYEP